jgi:cation/acetate symporter
MPARRFGTPLRLFAAAILLATIIAAFLVEFGINGRLMTGFLAAVVLLAVLAMGVVARTMRIGEFQFGGAGMAPVHGGMATAGAFLSSVGLLGLAGLFFADGETAGAFLLGTVGGFVLLAVAILPFFKASGAATVPDFFASRFGGRIFRLVASALVVLIGLFFLAAEFAVAGGFLARLFRITMPLGIGLSAALVLVIAVLGGLRAVSLAAAADYILVLVASLLPVVLYAASEFGMPLPEIAAGAALREVATFPNAAIAALSNAVVEIPGLPVTGLGPYERLALILTVVAGIAGLPHIVMRAGLSRSPAHARRSGAFAFLFVMLVVTAAPAYAAFSKFIMLDTLVGTPLAALPDWVIAFGRIGLVRICGVDAVSAAAVVKACAEAGLATLDPARLTLSGDLIVLAFPALADLPAILGLLAVIGAVAASLAAAGALLFAVASAVGFDFYVGLFDRAAPAGRRLLAIRIALIGTAFLAAWLAATDRTAMLRWAGLALSLSAAGIFPPLVLGLWWKRCTSLGALAGMLSGASVAGFYFALTAIDGEKLWSWFGLAGTAVPPFAAAAFGLPVAFVVAVLVSLATPPEPDRARLVEAIRRPAGRPSGEDDD